MVRPIFPGVTLMKVFAMTLAALALAPSVSAQPAGVTSVAIDSRAADIAAIMTAIESVATLADRGDFDALEGIYAPEVRLDYTNVFGGQPELVSNTALMTRWAGVLPGFDRTRHTLSDVRVSIDGNHATATANIVADHWIGGQSWQLRGRYVYALVRDSRDWRITAHTLTGTGETGSRDVLALASTAATNNPAPYLQRQTTRRVVLDFLEGLETKDMARVNGVWADDAVQDMPYSPPGHPRRVVGRQALIDLYAGWPHVSGRAEFTDGIVFHPTLDPEIVFVEYKGTVEVVPTGRTYRQSYGGLFHIENGKITLFREYYDPAAFAWAFNLQGGPALRENP
jgi:ketosteroid isomerase-like protein